MSDSLLEILRRTRVVPVAVLDEVGAALRTAAVLVECELPVIEITLRTGAALSLIHI